MLVKDLIKLSVISITWFSLCLSSLAENETTRKLPRPPVESSGTMVINWSVLNLSPSQRERIRLLRIDFQKLSIKLKAEIDLKQIDIEKLLISPTSDGSEIRKIMRDKLALESKLKMEALDNFIEIKSLLTTDQLAKLPRAVTMK
ncbi:MAG: Spy/CpxP family protein refolding chaperone [Candidatus Sericytochromatia bacterium]